jgi:hypothetical protein
VDCHVATISWGSCPCETLARFNCVVCDYSTLLSAAFVRLRARPHTAAAPPRSVMNSRRFTSQVPPVLERKE